MTFPSCYGKFVCLDDCVVSCALWEECMIESEIQEDYEDWEDDYPYELRGVENG